MSEITVATVSEWVNEFFTRDSAGVGFVGDLLDVTVINDVLVAVGLVSIPTETYLRRESKESPEWTVTFMSRLESTRVRADAADSLGTEIRALSSLCSHLTSRTRDYGSR